MIDPAIERVRVEPIKRSSTPAATFRLWLDGNKKPEPRSVVVKKMDPGWPDDPTGHEREVRFFARLSPKLEINRPHIYYAGQEPGMETWLVIMEDLAGAYRFPAADHRWSQSEINLVMRAYARLHASGRACLAKDDDREWMLARHERRLLETADKLPVMIQDLVAAGIWPPLPGFSHLLERTLRDVARFSDHPVTVLHNDVTPSNCGLPIELSGEAVLLDWEMAGWGLAEMDLAYMFLQPFGSHLGLDRKAALDYYWVQRQGLEGRRPKEIDRKAVQKYADALWVLWLIPVAHRMAAAPFPPGSAPRTYWEAMHRVLGERLGTMCHGF